jgi:uncharacterized protein YdeI (YjbR/CyaY-like superfamily)
MALEPHDVAFFTSTEAFRAWLAEHHDSADELWVGMYKKASPKPSVPWSDMVDAALCFGWIDGIRKSLDDESFTNRFTPRRPGSVWSKVNLDKVDRLRKAGLMEPAGIAAWEARTAKKMGLYSFEQDDPVDLTAEQVKVFKRTKAAWAFWEDQPPGYRRLAAHWVNSAMKEETRERRLGILIQDSVDGLRIKHLRR